MRSNPFDIGDIIIVKFPLHNPQGKEQEGIRPAVVIGIPQKVGNSRFPIILVAPMTTEKGQMWASSSPNLYPKLFEGQAGLPKASIILLDQIRAIDLKRVVRYLGTLKPVEYQFIFTNIQKIIFR